MRNSNQLIYKQLLQRYGSIRIPMIQRDYAQGRKLEQEVRQEFLNALENALKKPSNDSTLPLNLDFIYGSVEGNEAKRFLPLDGQQRLTTLFLLHWYLTWQDQQWEIFEQLFNAGGKAKFSYSVRTSSNDFFDKLVCFRPSEQPEMIDSLTDLIEDQSWYFLRWRLDPTIKSVLNMLEAIHCRFRYAQGLFIRLVDEDQPAITFQLLELDNFGLSDDLYIKMNSRGKPLTAFETFKARYEQELLTQLQGSTFNIGEYFFTASEYISRCLDVKWADLFWKVGRKDSKKPLYDDALMNVFRAIALVTRSTENDSYLDDIERFRSGLRPPAYTEFHSRGWLDEQFTITLIKLLDAWSKENGLLSVLLPRQRYFDEDAFFRKITSIGSSLQYVEIVQFAAYAGYVTQHHDHIVGETFQEWMRLIFNLSVNTDYNRSADLRRSIIGISQLIGHPETILSHFAESTTPVSGFDGQQIKEEKLKAALLLADERWKNVIDRAEGHDYFQGQIEFILDFSGVLEVAIELPPKDWSKEIHGDLVIRFLRILNIAETMFTSNGLNDLEKYRWQRALLSLGDYLLPRTRNVSFLVNSVTDDASWKRLLKGDRISGNARNVLRKLFSQLSPTDSITEQLDEIIESADDIEPWQRALIGCPEAFEFCDSMQIRKEDGSIYLLKRSQMNGAHAELFTFALHHGILLELSRSGALSPLFLEEYFTVNGIDFEPGVRLSLHYKNKIINFEVDNNGSGFQTYVLLKSFEEGDSLKIFIEDKLGFSASHNTLFKNNERHEIVDFLKEIAAGLTNYFSTNFNNT